MQKKTILTYLLLIGLLTPNANAKVEYLEPLEVISDNKTTRSKFKVKKNIKKKSFSKQNKLYKEQSVQTKKIGYKIAGLILVIVGLIAGGISAIVAIVFCVSSNLILGISFLIVALVFYIAALIGAGLLRKFKRINSEPVEEKETEIEKTKEEENKATTTTTTTRDVVYLKNGSIIKGELVEVIPDEQVKIKTSDGSLFVYKMSEVSKIEKEKHE